VNAGGAWSNQPTNQPCHLSGCVRASWAGGASK